MRIERVEIDSDVLGRNVLSIADLTATDDLAAAERGYQQEFRPGYVSCRVPLEDLATVHRLEEHGFQLIECQIRSAIRFKCEFDVTRYPYEYHQVTTRDALEEVLAIARTTVVHDRFTVDAAVPTGISGERYSRYVQKSFERSDEEVWRLYDPLAKMTLGFRTHRHTGPREVLLLLGGIHPEFKELGLGVVSSYFCFNQMRRDGIKKAITHISAINYPIFNLEIGFLGFRVLGTFAVMRKTYA